MRVRTRVAAVAVPVVAVLALSGCSSSSTPQAEAAVGRFYDAYNHHDGTRACSLLAAATRAAVEQSSGKACADGILAEKLPSVPTTLHASVYGDQAQVRTDTDTAFVARFPSGWRVMAVGCIRHPDAPYDCQVEAG